MARPEEKTAPPLPRAVLAAILTAAAAVRIAALIFASRTPLFTQHRLDELYYHEAGQRLASGDWAFGREVLHMSPGYTYLVGIVYRLLGDGPWPMRAVQLLLGLGTVALVTDAARRLVGPRWAIAAGLVAALYGPLIFYESELLVATLGAFLHALLLWAALVAVERATPLAWAACGLIVGACALARPSALLYVPVLAGFAWHGARRGAALLLLPLACALPIGIVFARNVAVAGEPVLITDAGGLNFFIGNGRGAIGTFRIPKSVPDAVNAGQQFTAFRRVAEAETGHPLDARGVDAFWYRQALLRIQLDPGGWLALMGEKLWLYWSGRELPNTEDYAFNRLLNPVLALPLVQYVALAPFALLGTLAWLGFGERRARLVALLNLTSCLGVTAFFVLAHYRIPAIPGLILAAVGAARLLVEVLRTRRWRTAALLSVVVAAGGVLAAWPKFPKAFDDEWFKLGYAYHVRGELDDAARAYERALVINPGNRVARENLAILLERRGRPELARPHREALAAP